MRVQTVHSASPCGRGLAGSRTRATDDDLELDRDFLQQLHDLKLKLIDKAWVERRQKAVMKGQQALLTHTLRTVLDPSLCPTPLCLQTSSGSCPLLSTEPWTATSKYCLGRL